MRNFAPFNKSTFIVARLGALVSAALFLAAFVVPTAFMQEGSGQVEVAERIKLSRAATKEDSKSGASDEANAESQAAAPLAPEAITVLTYPFTSSAAVLLEDMSSGTTQLVAAGSDDGNSTIQNIGFDFWYDGVRFTTFGANANGFIKLGAVVGTSAFTNDLDSTTEAPKIAGFWDDLCTGTTGKVHFKVIGAAPSRKLIVEFQNMQITRGAGCAGVGGGTFQVWVHESAHATPTLPGVIEMVYGAGMTGSVDGGYSVGLQSGVATNVASIVTAGPSVLYGSANDIQTNAITSGTKYTFTPNFPNAPSNNLVTGITQTSLTLNWLDNATNEVGYVIYRSTDNVNFSFIAQIAANTTSFTDTGLNPGTNYFYTVQAVSEGALSALTSFGATTLPAGNISSTAAGGNWSDTATWVGGVVPTSTDNVTIVDGATVTIDVTTAACLNLTVGQGTSGILQYISTPASTLTVNGDATVAAGGTFTAGAGGLTTHVLNIGGSSTASGAAGNLTVNGTFDMNTTAGATTNFFGSTNGTISGGGATADFQSIVGQKGTNQAAILDVTRVITIAAAPASGAAGLRLSVTGGTVKISSATVATPWFGSQTITGANGKLWINNAGASLQCVGTGVSATGAGSPTFTGGLQVDTGTFGYGQGNNTMTIGATTGSLVMNGGTINMFGALLFSANSSLTMTAGNINIDPQNVANIAATTNLLRFTGPNVVSATGGTITIVDPHAATGTGRALSISTSSGSYNFTGNTIRFGDGVSTTAGSVDGFDIDTFVGLALIPVGNITVDNTATNAATRFVRANTAVAPLQVLIFGDLTITAAGGSRFNLNGNLVGFGKDIINNGTLDGTTAASRLYWFGNGLASNYSGTGTVTTPLVQMDLDNPLGVTINPAVSQIILSSRINLFRGTLTNTNKVTFGTGAALAFDLQYGVAGGVTPGGNLDQSPVFNLGTGVYTVTYSQESVGRTTSFEFPATRIVNAIVVNNTNNVTLAGGDLTLSNAATAATFTNGRFITGANTLILSSGTATVTRTNGYVDGNFRKTYTATGSKTFEVGTANSFSPAAMNVTTLTTTPSTLTVRAVQGPQPVLNPATSLQRYWNVLEGGDLTATMTFTYATDALDVVGTEANYRVIRVTGGTAVNFPEVCPTGPCVDEAANNFNVPGVTNFSDWTAGEQAAPTAAPATISGRATTSNGAPLAGVTMNLGGARSARTITDVNGNYRFINIDTDNFYTVTPSITNYHFSPASRAFSLLANVTDAVFTGTVNDVISGNVIDTPEYFVRQHYLDFLGREPDSAGLDFWSDQMLGCGNDYNCLERRTINVSAAYFLSIEFQETGGLVDGLYRASYGRAPLFSEFVPDTATVADGVIVGEPDWRNTLDTNKQEFLDAWVQRAAFRTAYDNLANGAYVATLVGHTGVDFTNEERQTLLRGLEDGTLSRAQVLGRIAQDERFVTAKFNEAFVRMQYFGYLRRDPDDSGFHFWLNKLNEFEGNFERAQMVKAFLVSGEYRDRFRQ